MNKICTKCNKTMELSEFIYRTDLNCYEGRCRECARLYLIEYYKTHKEKASTTARKRYKKNKKYILARVQSYYKNNRENKKQYARKWHKLHPESARCSSRKRKALKFNVNENYTQEDEKYTRELFGNCCANCKSTNNLTIDHHYPLSKGNALTRQNAVLLCHICNNNKRAKHPSKFYLARVLRVIEKKLGILSSQRSENKFQQTYV